MTAFAGGPADKFGNQYESWWTICCLIDVLHGRANWIKLEPIGVQGEGVEFVLNTGGTTVVDQVKSGTSFARWTLSKLAPVVESARRHLVTGERVRLIAAAPPDPATSQLLTAIRVRPQNSSEALPTSALTNGLEEFADKLGVPPEEALVLLSRFEFVHHASDGLEALARSRLDNAIVDFSDAGLLAIHGWLFTQTHRALYAEDIRGGFESLGLVVRPRLGDPATSAALSRGVIAFSNRLANVHGTHPVIARQDLNVAIEHLLGPAKILLIHGGAGSGKSTFVDQIIKHPRLSSLKFAAVRLDSLGSPALTADSLGQAVGLAGSPATLLGDLCGGEPSVLVLDQLDAVSTFSGRIPDTFEGVQETLSMASAWRQMKIVLAVRSVDLLNDQRLAAIGARADCVSLELEPLTDEELDESLRSGGIDPDEIHPSTRELVRNPLDLGLFFEFQAGDERGGSPILTIELLAAKERRRRTEAKDGDLVDQWAETLNTLAQRLSDSEQLSIDVDQLGDLQPTLSRLASAGLVAIDGGRVSFFHERYFDFVFARSFVDEQGDLREHLLKAGQSLFRRSQVRQVLEYLHERSSRRFFLVALEILMDTSIRAHLKQVVIQVLRSSNPTPGDWRPFATVALTESYVGAEVRALFGSVAWFDAAEANGDVEKLLDSAHHLEIASAIAVVAAERFARVAELLTPHVGHPDASRWGSDLIERGHFDPRHPFTQTMVDAGLLDGAADRSQICQEAWWALYANVEGEARFDWLRILLSRALTLSDEAGVADPFEAGIVEHANNPVADTLSDLAGTDPRQFLNAVLPFIVQVSKATATSNDPTKLAKCRWHRWTAPVIRKFDDALLDAAAKALEHGNWTADELDELEASLNSEVATLRFLFSRALVGQDDANRAAEWLGASRQNLGLAWQSGEYGVAREIIARHQRALSTESLDALLKAIHMEVSSWERSTRGRGWTQRGWAEWLMLLAFDDDVLPGDSRMRRDELIRKFKDVAPSGRETSGGFVTSPIPQSAAEHMTNDHWIGAMRKYAGSRHHDSDDFLKGGADELSQLLAATVESDPERFHSLYLALPPWVNETYRLALLGALAGRIPATDWAASALECLDRDPSDAPKAVAWGAEKYESPWPEDLVSVVLRCAEDPDPRPGDSPHVEVGGASMGESLLTESLNCTRGAAAHAISRHLWGSPASPEPIYAAVGTLATDQSPAVRTAACNAIGAISRIDVDLAIELTVANLQCGLEPVASSAGYELLRFAAGRNLDLVAPFISRGIAASEKSLAENMGLVWAHLEYWEKLPEGFTDRYSELPSGVRKGVAKLWANNAADDPDKARQVLDDPDAEVRAELTGALQEVDPEHSAEAAVVLPSLIYMADDDTFVEFKDDLVRFLYGAPGKLPPVATKIVDRVLGEVKTVGTRMRTPLLADLIVRLLREGSDNETHLDHLDSLIEARVPMWRALPDD